MFVYKNCLHFFSEHSPTNSETNDITLTEEELLLKRFEHNEGIQNYRFFFQKKNRIKKTCVSAVCLHFFSPPDGSVLVTYTNDEGPIANSSIIDASKLGEQLPNCLFTFLCLPFFVYIFFVYIPRPIWVSLLCHRGGICSTSTSHLHGIYTVTGESQLFVYIFTGRTLGI